MLLVALGTQVSLRAQLEGQPVVVERGRDHQVWRLISEQNLANDRVRLVTNDYVQLGVGLNYPKDGVWHESKAQFELFPGGAVAREGLFQVIIGPDAAQESLLDVLTPDGTRLRASPRWLAYYDRTTGQAEIIAAVKSCQGQLVAPNTIIFPDAFDDIHAALRYTYQPYGIEQEIVLLDADPLKPAQWGFNNPNGDVVLEMWSEFHEWPQLDRIVTSDNGGRSDSTLHFGEALIGNGKAFPLGDEENAIVVAKTWTSIEQRQFLIEAVRQCDLDGILAGLPKQARVRPPGAKQNANLAQGRRMLQGRKELLARAQERLTTRERRLQTASIGTGNPNLGAGVSIDYSFVTTASDVTFESTKTYYVTNTVTLSGTTTIEGGATIKFDNVTNGASPRIIVTGPVVCLTDQYRPAVFTGKDDNSVGETISGSSGTPGTNRYALRAIEFGSASYTNNLHDLRIRYADKAFGLSAVSGINYSVWHSQISDVNYGFYNLQVNVVALIKNVLLYNALVAVAPQTGGTTAMEHVTMHVVGRLRNSTSGSLWATNCLFISVTNDLTLQQSACVITNLSDTGIFTTVGGGRHYLASGSPYRDIGSNGLVAALVTDRRKRTTYPPLVLTNDITSDTTLYLQAQRDTDTPDVGYAYDPLDYLVGDRLITNATLTIGSAAAVGISGGGGLTLHTGSKLSSTGTPDVMNRICPYYQVQEAATNWGSSVSSLIKVSTAVTTYPEITLRFTEFPMALGSPRLIDFDVVGPSRMTMRDCSVLGGTLYVAPIDIAVTNYVALTNNLIDSATWLFEQGYEASTTKMSVHMRNNLLYRGALSLLHDDTTLGSWFVHDNLFWTNTLATTVSHAITNSHNGFYNTAPLSNTWGSNQTLNTNSPFFQVGSLGRFYYPTSGIAGSLTNLWNAGSRYATNAGLYHYTTATNQTKEAGSKVDIGFHYIAVNASGQPLDSDGDATPDYLEDANGNGAPDSAETDWSNPNDLGLRILITRPRRSQNIP